MAPPRPSRNLDRALLAAGRELFPSRGCAGLTVREVADAAGVNLGMFHYHFKSREAFLRALLQSVYEELFSELSRQASLMPREKGPVPAADVLRSAMHFIARFVRANRPVLARVMADGLNGDPIAREFLEKNMPRHLGLIHAVVEAGRKDGSLRDLPAPQIIGFCAGAVALPIIFAGAVVEALTPAVPASKVLNEALLTEAAIDQRIEMALDAVGSPPRPRPRTGPRKPRGKP